MSTIKRLGATVVVANTDTELYETPAGKSAVVSSIVVCNIGATERTFRVAIVEATAVGSVGNKDYLYYDMSIPGNNTFVATIGATMATVNIILVRASHAEVVFSAFGSEV